MAFSLRLPGLVLPISADARAYEDVMQKLPKAAEEAANKINVSTRRIGRQLTLALTAPLAAIGALSVKSFGDFDKAITQTSAVFGGVTDDIRKRMENAARTISTQTTFASDELARSLVTIARTGSDAENAINALGVTARFAQANAADLEKSTVLLADALSSLGLKARDPETRLKNMEKLSNALTLAGIKSQGSADQFALSLTRKAGPAIRTMNLGLEEGIALLSVYADQGIKGSLAGERVDIVLRELARAQSKSSQLWKSLGLSLTDNENKLRPLADIFDDLNSVIKESDPVMRRLNLHHLGFQDRAVAATLAIIDQGAALRAYTQQQREHGEVVDKLNKIQLQSFANQMKLLRNEIQLAEQDLGKALAPALKAVTKIVVVLTDAFRALPPWLQTVVASVGGILVITGPLILAFGQLVFFTNQAILVFRGLKTASLEKAQALQASTLAIAGDTSATQAAVVANEALIASEGRVAAATRARHSIRSTGGKFVSAATLEQPGMQRGSAAGQQTLPFTATSLFSESARAGLDYTRKVESASLATGVLIQKTTDLNKVNEVARQNMTAMVSPLFKDYMKGVQASGRAVSDLTAHQKSNMDAVNRVAAAYKQLDRQTGGLQSQLSRTSKILDDSGTNYQVMEVGINKVADATKQLTEKVKPTQLNLFNEAGQATATSLQRMNLILDTQNKALPLNMRQWQTGVAAYQTVAVSQDALAAANKRSTFSTFAHASAARIATASNVAWAASNRALAATLHGVKVAAQGVASVVGPLAAGFAALAGVVVAVQGILDVIDAVRGAFGGKDANSDMAASERTKMITAQTTAMERQAQVSTENRTAEIDRMKDVNTKKKAIEEEIRLAKTFVAEQERNAKKVKDQMKDEFLVRTRIGRLADTLTSKLSGERTRKDIFAGDLESVEKAGKTATTQLNAFEDQLRNLRNEQKKFDLKQIAKSADEIKKLDREFQLLNPNLTKTEREFLKLKFRMKDLGDQGIPGLKQIEADAKRNILAERQKAFADEWRRVNNEIQQTNSLLTDTEAKIVRIVQQMREMQKSGFNPQQIKAFGDALLKIEQNRFAKNIQDQTTKMFDSVLLLRSSAGKAGGAAQFGPSRRDVIADSFKVIDLAHNMKQLLFTQAEITAETNRYSKALKDVRNAKAFDALRTDSEKLVESMKSPEQKFKDQLKVLTLMKNAGLITQEQFKKAGREAQSVLGDDREREKSKLKKQFERGIIGKAEFDRRMVDLEKGTPKKIYETKFAGAVEAGSVDAVSAVNRAIAGRQTDQARQLEQQRLQTELAKTTNVTLKDIHGELKNKPKPSIAAGVPY